jgi:hypothetical protein
MDQGQSTRIDPKELHAMNYATLNEVSCPGPWITVPSQPDSERRKRILAALGLPASRNPHVNEESLGRYYDYLAAHLELPFMAYYPRPSTPANAAVDRCEVIALLDPRTDLCDEFDGLYCQTRKGRFRVNLPLVELTILPPSKNIELLGDYEYWFWHWRD